LFPFDCSWKMNHMSQTDSNSHHRYRKPHTLIGKLAYRLGTHKATIKKTMFAVGMVLLILLITFYYKKILL
jgi:hypothetical protein